MRKYINEDALSSMDGMSVEIFRDKEQSKSLGRLRIHSIIKKEDGVQMKLGTPQGLIGGKSIDITVDLSCKMNTMTANGKILPPPNPSSKNKTEVLTDVKVYNSDLQKRICSRLAIKSPAAMKEGKKVVKLTESELVQLINRVIKEQIAGPDPKKIITECFMQHMNMSDLSKIPTCSEVAMEVFKSKKLPQDFEKGFRCATEIGKAIGADPYKAFEKLLAINDCIVNKQLIKY